MTSSLRTRLTHAFRWNFTKFLVLRILIWMSCLWHFVWTIGFLSEGPWSCSNTHPLQHLALNNIGKKLHLKNKWRVFFRSLKTRWACSNLYIEYLATLSPVKSFWFTAIYVTKACLASQQDLGEWRVSYIPFMRNFTCEWTIAVASERPLSSGHLSRVLPICYILLVIKFTSNLVYWSPDPCIWCYSLHQPNVTSCKWYS